MLSFKQFLIETSTLTYQPTYHPISKMREYTEKEFPWEYREYTNYSKSRFPRAFDSFEHFTKKYNEAPLVHLHPDDIHNLEYSTASSYMHNNAPIHAKEASVRAAMGHRRNLDRIYNELHHGKMAPPIVLKHSKGYRILGGNTRLSAAAAHNINIPVKLIDISDRH